jgi:hypothetical protein
VQRDTDCHAGLPFDVGDRRGRDQFRRRRKSVG